MSQELLVLTQKENIQTIVSQAPQAYEDNALSRDRCYEAGKQILDAIQLQGMTDELDQAAAQYIEKARKTLKKMNEKRSPVTKLFDDIRKAYTAMENTIDPTKNGTIPYELQQLRNQYAAKKRAEEEERRRKEYERQQAEALRMRMMQDIEDDFKRQFHSLVNGACNALSQIDAMVTLENFETSMAQIKDYPTEIPSEFLQNMHTLIRIPAGITIDEIRKAEAEIKKSLTKEFTEHYCFEIEDTKQYILDRLPSKRANLETIRKASAEEAARIKAEMQERQRKEAEQMELERRQKEENDKQKAEMMRQQSDMESLFAAQSLATPSYQQKVKVAQKINLLNPEGIMPILSMWWTKEGCTLSTDELTKMFKKQITFCEKLAKEGIYLSDESVEYVEDIKAK